MGGEMIFTHNDKVIEDLDSYKKLLKKMKNDCAALPQPAPEEAIRLISNPISNWKNGYVTKYGKKGIGQDDDYELSVDLGRSLRNRDNHYYVLFPKDPNKLKVISNTHARGLNLDTEQIGCNKKWIHNYFLKFVTKFPGVFELYYGDGYYGADGEGIFGDNDFECYYRDGSDVPVRRIYPDSCTYH